MKEKNHISIYGCCVSRDGFSQHLEDGGYVIDKYIQAVSPFLALKSKKGKGRGLCRHSESAGWPE